MAELATIEFDAPLVNPAPGGLFPATTWPADSETPRWLPAGVQFKVWNYGGDVKVWSPAWDVAEEDLGDDDVKTGVRPDNPDPFVAITMYAEDDGRPEAGEMSDAAQRQVQTRVSQNLRLLGPVLVEKALGARMISDSPINPSITDIAEAVGTIEEWFGETNTLGFIHASPAVAARAASKALIVRSGTGLKSPMGHTWVFGGGYGDALALKLCATSPTYGWRTEVAVRGDVRADHHGYSAVAEQSVVVGYETMLGFVDLAD